jgi:uncharacterized protein involved in response to NO
MSVNALTFSLPGPALRLLAAAPHRLLFFVGATNVLLAMVWWALWLIDMRWQVLGLPQPSIPAGWLHATVMQYQVLPAFMFGFLLTVFPRWMNQPALTRWHYVPVGIGLLGGQVLTLVGALGFTSLLHVGAILTLIGWGMGLCILGQLVWRDAARTWHAVSCHMALCFGWIGFFLYATYLHTFDASAMFASIKLGSIGLLLPIFFTVCHRMIPFFTSCVYRDYRIVRPMWTLTLFWMLALAHLFLEMSHGYAWLWVVDVPMALLGLALLWMWWPRQRAMPNLLRVLFIGFAWLPIAFALFAAQSLWYAISSEFLLGRAPSHALFIGCFGSLLVAMVTRVTQGHAGRPLQLGGVAGLAFALIQLLAVTRIVAEVVPESLAWQAVTAVGWCIAFMPWVIKSAWIYLTPRRDGQSG